MAFRRDLLVIVILSSLLYLILGVYSYQVYGQIYSSEIVIEGSTHDLIKLRGFIEDIGNDEFTLINGGYLYTIRNPSQLPIKQTFWGDTAVFLFDDGSEYVAVHIVQQDFIYIKYLISLLAGLFVCWRLITEFVDIRRQDHV